MNKLYLPIGVVILIGAGFLIFKSPTLAPTPIFNPNPNPVACTMEAKLCPDGSYVGRSGPNCEFSACPSAPVPKPGSEKSGITGTVTLGPICPVERIPPDPSCAPQFYSTSINIMKAGNKSFVKTIKSNSKGIFSVELAPGSYILQAQGGNMLPRCGQVSSEVKSGQYTKAEISCDTGIR